MTEMILMCDCETANTLDEPILYDFGAWLIDSEGHSYEKVNWVIKEAFLNKELMETAYFRDKIPAYWQDIWAGKRQVKSIWDVYRYLRDVQKRYPNVKFCAHNAAFDVKALRTSLRYLTKSFKRWMVPFNMEIYDTLRMARDTICKDEEYVKFCEAHSFLTDKGKPQATAEVLYRFLTNDLEFNEEHTGLADVEIEAQILQEIYNRYEGFRKHCFNKQCKPEPAPQLVAQVLSVN